MSNVISHEVFVHHLMLREIRKLEALGLDEYEIQEILEEVLVKIEEPHNDN